MAIFNNFLDKMFDSLKKKAIKRGLKNDPELKKINTDINQSRNEIAVLMKKWEKDQEKIKNENETN